MTSPSPKPSLFRSWLNLGPGHLWFWLTPLVILACLATLIRAVLGL